MFEWLKNRAREASTYGGLGLITLGLGDLFRINEAPAIADGLNQVAGLVAQTGGLNLYGVALTALGVLGTILKEKGQNK